MQVRCPDRRHPVSRAAEPGRGRQTDRVNDYTVIIEERDDAGAWLPLAPPETVSDEGTADEVARWRAGNDTMAAAGVWRVRVWDGADADPDSPEASCVEIGRG
jgi:hypothetical protein